MMNPMSPWNRQEQLQPRKPSNGIAWLVSVIVAVIGLVALAKSGGNKAVVVPIFISVSFMVMFLFSHRRENKRIVRARQDAEFRHQDALIAAASEAEVNKQRDKDLRKIFDRFDVMVIEKEHGHYNMNAKAVAEILEYARDFVDANHAIELMNKGQMKELRIHLKAAYERATLQLALAKPEKKQDYEALF